MNRCFALTLAGLVVLTCAIAPAQTATCTNLKTFSFSYPLLRTLPSGINRWGSVVGYTYDPSGIDQAFTRYSDGSIKFYSAPSSSGTQFSRRNSQGVTVGTFYDTTSSHHAHGLVVSGSSTATVNYPGAPNTFLRGINYWGSIVGNYSDSSGNLHGFELKNGNLTKIDYPGAVWTNAASISDKGVIVGSYANAGASGGIGHFHGFILQNGVYKTLDDPQGVGGGTALQDINSSGVIVGVSFPTENPQSFIYINGTLKYITVPNGASTTVSGLNGYDYITGETTINGASTGYIMHCQ
jgi:hypothetical protein